MTESQFENLSLLPERHPTKDFFIADIFDNLPFKDDIASMEHPIFTLSKKKDLRDLEYRYGDVRISIQPTSDGLPNIFDKDVLLYCGSMLMEQINKGTIPPKTLRISSHDLLVATNRPTSGEGYTLLKKALDRLSGVKIKTNIKTNKREITERFGLIDKYTIIESSRVKKRMVRLEITLSDWFYNSIIGKEVLTINREYFRLGKALERRLYEIARKHCGKNPEWSIGLKKLK
ncbi:MAG: replication initiator protein A, partial [Lewinella sp.]|nr:replication initiator protein A [Lewinella sp.]